MEIMGYSYEGFLKGKVLSKFFYPHTTKIWGLLSYITHYNVMFTTSLLNYHHCMKELGAIFCSLIYGPTFRLLWQVMTVSHIQTFQQTFDEGLFRYTATRQSYGHICQPNPFWHNILSSRKMCSLYVSHILWRYHPFRRIL